jgi:hypothetical protein
VSPEGIAATDRKGLSVEALGQTLWQLVQVLLQLSQQVVELALQWSLLVVWIAWWLCGVNWSKVWPVLARGAWAPVVLLMVTGALVWSSIAPGPCTCLPDIIVPNFWWQLGAVGLLAAVTLFCGWLQGVFGWQPAEISLEPPVTTVPLHDHHDSGHGPEHRDVEEIPRAAGAHH